ncbi:MAG: hypothetical protein Q9190_007101 [Brigantiaea leucoxantha]
MFREAGGLSSLTGAFPILVHPRNSHHLTLSDVKSHIIPDGIDIHKPPTRLISLENTLNGTILPLSDAQAISSWAHAQSPPIKLHLDGARLWEAVAAGAGSLKDYCAPFDSISLCFSKGLGAPIGSILVGSQPFIDTARRIRKALGGGLRQSGIVAAPARIAVEETFLGGKLAASHEMARKVAGMWEAKGGKLQYAVETNMVWFDLDAAGCAVERFVEVGVREGVKVRGGRLVVHCQIGDEGLQRLERVMDEVLLPGLSAAAAAAATEEQQRGKRKRERDVHEEAKKVRGPEME